MTQQRDLPSGISKSIAAKGNLNEETEKDSEVDWQLSTSRQKIIISPDNNLIYMKKYDRHVLEMTSMKNMKDLCEARSFRPTN